MKKFNLYTGLLLVTVIGLTSCKNDLDVLEPGEESVSVYGILNPNDHVQYIRINKVYLTDGDALTAAQDPNQTNYGPGELEVTLERYANGIQMSVNSATQQVTQASPANDKRIVLTETVIPTSSGVFSTQQRFWTTTKKLLLTQPSSTYPNAVNEYKLNIRNLQTGAEFSSQTIVIDSVKTAGASQPMPFLWIPQNPTAYPMHGSYPVNPTTLDKPKYVNYDALTQTFRIKFKSIPNARLYNLVMRFHYIDTLTDNSAIAKYADFEFSTYKAGSLAGGEDVEFSFVANEFYVNLADKIAKNPVANIKSRRTHYLEYIVQAGAQSLYEFMEVNAPSNTIAQDKPSYSNIKGGVGVFSSRSRTNVTKDLWNDFIDKIACHPSTQPLLFCNSSGAKVPVPCN